MISSQLLAGTDPVQSAHESRAWVWQGSVVETKYIRTIGQHPNEPALEQ
jgi:hypothetical protein